MPIIKSAACRKMYVNAVPCYLRNSMDNAFKKTNRGCMTLLLVVKPRARLRASTPRHAMGRFSFKCLFRSRLSSERDHATPTHNHRPHLLKIQPIFRQNVGIFGIPSNVPPGKAKNCGNFKNFSGNDFRAVSGNFGADVIERADFYVLQTAC